MDTAETSLPQSPASSSLPLRSPPSTTDSQLSRRSKHTDPATCSTSSCASYHDRSTLPIERPPTRPKRRRRSRARPSPPITRVLALDQAHFKHVVHQFTDKGTLHGKCLDAAPSPVTIATSQPRRCPPAPLYPGPASPAIARCLDLTLQMLLACVVKFLHGHSEGCAPATCTPATSNAMALLEAFCRSQEQGDVCSQQESLLKATPVLSNEPLCIPLFPPYDDLGFRAALHPDQDFVLKARRDETRATASSIHVTDGDVLQPASGDSRCSVSTRQHNLELEQDKINSQRSNDGHSLLADHFMELERFPFDGLNSNEEIDRLGLPGFGLSSTRASSYDDLFALS